MRCNGCAIWGKLRFCRGAIFRSGRGSRRFPAICRLCGLRPGPTGQGGLAITGVNLSGPQVTLSTYGDVVEVTAIVGSGARNGVDMAWGTQTLFGHFGLDLTGASGGIVRIDDIVIEDVSRFFLRDIVSAVDVRDFGAVGDGVADDHAAFEAADSAANGREIIVPAGTYFLGQSTTIQNRIRFEGTLEMAESSILALPRISICLPISMPLATANWPSKRPIRRF